MPQATRTMRTKKGNGSQSVNRQNGDTATTVTKNIKSDSSGTLRSLATPNRRTVNDTASPTLKSVRRAHRAGPFKDCSSVGTHSLASVRSAAPVSGCVKVRTGKMTPDTMAVLSLASRRSFEGGPISEERFREMQAESYRLKRDLAEKEELQKALVVRLNRAEGSVKRKLRASVENISLHPKEKLSVLAVLTQNFNTGKKVEELEERLRVSHRDNLRYLQHGRRCKSETQWYKRRLDATVRASRRARSCNCQLSLKRYEKMVKDLRKQLSSLRKKKDCSSCCATGQSAVLLDVSELSTEDQNCPAGLPTSRERSGPYLLETSSLRSDRLNVKGAASDPVRKGDLRHGETEMCTSKVQLSSETSPKATESSLKETLQEQGLCDTLSKFDATSQLMATWERLKVLTLQHSKATEELRLLKVSYETCVQKLQDTHRKLSQERTNCLKLEAVEKGLSSELVAAKHLEPLLQQVRQQNLQLEIENAELVASALNVPRTSFSELTILRQQLVDELKQRKMAEAKASNVSTQLEDCKQDLARLSVVEANWEFLKSELEVAKAALRKADKKVTRSISARFTKRLGNRGANGLCRRTLTPVWFRWLIKELQDLNRRLHKEINMKGKGSLQMDSDTSVSRLCAASCEEENKTHLRQESEPEFGSAVEDSNISKQVTYWVQSGLQALRHENKDDTSHFMAEDLNNIAVKLCTSPQLNPNHHQDNTLA